MENELTEIKTSIQERNKGILLIPMMISICVVIIFFVSSHLLIAGLSVIISFCLFLYSNCFQILKLAKNIHFSSPRNIDEINMVVKLIQKEKNTNTNILPYIILYIGVVLCWSGIENTPFNLIEFAFLQFVVFSIIYFDQYNRKGIKYRILLKKLEILSCK